MRRFITSTFLYLAPQPSLGLGLLHKNLLNFLEASQQFSFLQDRVVSPMPNPHPGGPGLCASPNTTVIKSRRILAGQVARMGDM
jgi:hypothetical protein